jgi:hypothetical protein
MLGELISASLATEAKGREPNAPRLRHRDAGFPGGAADVCPAEFHLGGIQANRAGINNKGTKKQSGSLRGLNELNGGAG